MQCTRSVGESLKTPLRDRRRVGRWQNPSKEPRARLRDSCTWQLRRLLRFRLQYPHFDGMVALDAGTSRVHSRFINLVQAVGQILESRSSVENTAYIFRLCGLTSCIMRKGRASSRQPVWREPSSPGRSHNPSVGPVLWEVWRLTTLRSACSECFAAGAEPVYLADLLQHSSTLEICRESYLYSSARRNASSGSLPWWLTDRHLRSGCLPRITFLRCLIICVYRIYDPAQSRTSASRSS